MSSSSAIDFRQERGVGDVLNATFLFIKYNLVLLAKSLLVIVAPSMALTSVFAASIQATFFRLDLADPESVFALFGPAYFGTLFFSLLSTMLSLLVVYGFVVLYQDEGAGNFGVEDVWRFVRSHFLMVLGTTFFLLMLAGGLYVAVVLAAVIAASLVAAGGAALGGLLVVLLLLALAVGMAYFFTIAMLLYPMRLREAVGLLDGLQRSMYLVRGAWWPTFAVMMIAVITYSILGTLFNLPALIFGVLEGLHATEGGEGGGGLQLLLVVFGVIGGVGATMLYAIPLVATAFQYFSLVERKEKVGLMARVERLGEALPDAGSVADDPAPPSSPGLEPPAPSGPGRPEV